MSRTGAQSLPDKNEREKGIGFKKENKGESRSSCVVQRAKKGSATSVSAQDGEGCPEKKGKHCSQDSGELGYGGKAHKLFLPSRRGLEGLPLDRGKSKEQWL